MLYVTAEMRIVALAPCVLFTTRVRFESMRMPTVNARCDELTDPGGCSSVRRLLYVNVSCALRRCSIQEGPRTLLVQQLRPPLLQRQVGKVHYCLLKWSTYPTPGRLLATEGLAPDMNRVLQVPWKNTSDNTYMFPVKTAFALFMLAIDELASHMAAVACATPCAAHMFFSPLVCTRGNSLLVSPASRELEFLICGCRWQRQQWRWRRRGRER